MCGIAGFCDTTAQLAEPREDLERLVGTMTDLLTHRGPDGRGTYVDAHCCLGHRRLRIIDTSERARQPMSTPDGSLVLTFNGEVYNYRCLRRDLEANHSFTSSSDTEVLLQGYAQWGRQVFTRANGMCAAAFWDAGRRELVLARDRLGKKPLFYYWDGRSRVVFGSELKAVIAHPFVAGRRIDEQSLACYLAFGYVPTPRTIFEDIYKVPQGSTVTFRDGRRIIEPYWTPPAEEVELPEARALDELDALLRDAVRLRLESDVPIGFFLSGGIDSTLVTALGRELTPDVRTFTIGFKDPKYNEAPHARALAQHLGTQHTELELDESHFAEFFHEAPRYFDEPFADSSLIATYYLARVTRKHVTVALSGDGGDELFCGYQKYLNLAQLSPIMRMPAATRSVLGRLLRSIPRNTASKVGDALRSDSVDELARWLVSIWKPHELATLMPGATPRWSETQFGRAWDRFHERGNLTALMAADIVSYLPDDILQKVDRASMAVSLEMRSPLLDYRVVELALRLPLSLKFRHGQQKYLLRKLLARYVPESLWRRRKQGFNVPVKAWYRGPQNRRITDAITELSRAFDGALSTNAMEHYSSAHRSGVYDYSQKLFALDALSSWVRTYV